MTEKVEANLELIPTILYKCRPISKYTEQFFVDRKIRFSTAKELNDPAEYAVGVVNDLSVEHMSLYLRNFLNNPNISKNNKKEREISIRHILAQPDPSESLFSAVKQTIEMMSDVRILSLTENPINPVMWGHYAGNGQGICIGFRSIRSPIRHAIKVEYSDIEPEMRLSELVGTGRFPNNSAVVRRLFTKYRNWDYEREWRVLAKEEFAKINRHDIKCVIFGGKTSRENIVKYSNLIKDNGWSGVDLYIAKHEGYKLELYKLQGIFPKK